MIYLRYVNILERKMEDDILLYVKIMMDIGIHMMIQNVQGLLKKKSAVKMLMFFFIGEKTGDK